MADITLGEVVISATSAGYFNQLLKLSTDRFVHFWTNSSGYPIARVYTVQDRALTAVAAAQVLQEQDYTLGRANNPPMALRIDDDAFAVVFEDSGSNVAIKIWSENNGEPGTFDLEETNVLQSDVLTYQYYPCICEVNTSKLAVFFVVEVIATGVKSYVGYCLKLDGYSTTKTKSTVFTTAEWSTYPVGAFPRAFKISSAGAVTHDRLAVLFKNTSNNTGYCVMFSMRQGLLEASRKLNRRQIQQVTTYTIGHFNIGYVSDTKLAFIFQDTENTRTAMKVGTIDDDDFNLDFGDENRTGLTSSADCLRILRLTDRSFYVGFSDQNNSDKGYIVICTVNDDNDITINSIDLFRNAWTGGGNDWGLDLGLSSSATIIMAFQDHGDSEKPKLRAGNFLLPATESTFFSSDAETHLIYRHDGFSDTILSCYSAPGVPASSNLFGITWDGSNIISGDNTADKIYRMFSFTSEISDSFAYAGSLPRDLAYDSVTGYLYSIDGTADFIYEHSGFSATIGDSFSSPSSNPAGVAFDSINFYSTDIQEDKIYMHSGFTTEIKHSFSALSTSPLGICIGGMDLYSSDTDSGLLYHHAGFSATISYSFSSPSSKPRSVACEAGAFSRRTEGDTNIIGEESVIVLKEESGGSELGDDVGNTTETASPDIVSFHIDFYEEFDDRARMDARSNTANLLYYTAGTKRKFVLGLRNISLANRDKLKVLYDTQGIFDFYRRSTDIAKTATVKWSGDFDLYTPVNKSRQFTDLIYQGTITLEET